MTLETAKRILEELPQDDKARFQYRMKNWSRVREAEAICRGGFTFCEHDDDGSRAYLYLKVKPTLTDDESSIKNALEEYRMRKRQKQKEIEKNEPVTETANHPVQTINDNHQEQEPETKRSYTLSSTIAYLKRKINEFVKILDELVEE